MTMGRFLKLLMLLLIGILVACLGDGFSTSQRTMVVAQTSLTPDQTPTITARLAHRIVPHLQQLDSHQAQRFPSAQISLHYRPTTYYLSSAGDDANPGTSIEQPWKTIEKINQMIFQPGDRGQDPEGGAAGWPSRYRKNLAG